MKTILASTAVLVLAGGLSAPVCAQATATNQPAAQKKTPLTTLKVQTPHGAPKHSALGNGQRGRSKSSAKHASVGYQENDITAAKFGSQHWWTVQGWQAGGSSGQP
jgi:hypothetical protein